MKYNSYHYIYGPRPENAISPSDIDFWDNGSLISQPKLNGSNCLIFTDGKDIQVMNRHHQPLTNFRISREEIFSSFKPTYGNWMVLNGEYMNKSKSDEDGNIFNHKFVLFDILVLESEYMVGTTFDQRVKLMDGLFGQKNSDKSYLYSISENIFRVKSFDKGFECLYNQFSKIDMLEGLVMKRKNARLEIGTSEKNNTKSQLKCRVGTKNYKY